MPCGFELSCSVLLRLMLVFRRLRKAACPLLAHDFSDIQYLDFRDVPTLISRIHPIPPALLSKITFHL